MTYKKFLNKPKNAVFSEYDGIMGTTYSFIYFKFFTMHICYYKSNCST